MEPNQNIQVGNNIGDNAVSVQEPKKAANVPAMVFGLIAMVFAGLAVFFGLDYFKTEEKGNTQKDETTVVVVKSDMAEEYNEVNAMMQNLVSSIGGVYGGTIKNSSGLTYKPEGLNVYIPMKLNLEMTIWSSVESSIDDNAVAKLIDDKLRKNGFESVGVLPFTGSAGPEINGYLNSDSEIICGTYENVLECAKTSWSWLTEEEETLAKELETAYYDKIGKYPATLFGLNNEIEDSQYAPYQTIWVGLGGGAGLFYRVSPDAEWQFFRGTQSILDCSEYDTDDLKKAYLGEPCHLDMTESTVQL